MYIHNVHPSSFNFWVYVVKVLSSKFASVQLMALLKYNEGVDNTRSPQWTPRFGLYKLKYCGELAAAGHPVTTVCIAYAKIKLASANSRFCVFTVVVYQSHVKTVYVCTIILSRCHGRPWSTGDSPRWFKRSSLAFPILWLKRFKIHRNIDTQLSNIVQSCPFMIHFE